MHGHLFFSTLNTQTPLSRMKTFPVPCKILVSLIRRLTVGPCSSPLPLGAPCGRSFPLTSSMPNIIPDYEQQMLWHSLPNGWGLRRQKNHPGHEMLLNQREIDSSRKFNHPGRDALPMLSFHSLAILRTPWNVSKKEGKGSSMHRNAFVLAWITAYSSICWNEIVHYFLDMVMLPTNIPFCQSLHRCLAWVATPLKSLRIPLSLIASLLEFFHLRNLWRGSLPANLASSKTTARLQCSALIRLLSYLVVVPL